MRPLRMVKLLGGIVAISLQAELSYRANLLFSALTTAISLAAGVATLAILFSQAPTLAGWGPGEAVALLGAYQVVSGLLQTFVEPNLSWFANTVSSGRLDDLLLQPAPSILMASMGACQPWSLAQVALGALLMAVGVHGQPNVTAAGVAACLLLLAIGALIAWAARLLVAAAAFWLPSFDPTVLYSAFWQLGRYPVDIYPSALRRLLTYVVPVAFVATIPARALVRGADPTLLLGGLAAAGVAIGLVSLAWRAGLRRYTSATS